MNRKRGFLEWILQCGLSLAIFGALFVCLPDVANARITRIVITKIESPTFGGRSFGMVGPYEKLLGKASGEVDPNDRRNALITDISLAPRNSQGMVEYSMDIYFLKPVDMSKGNHKLIFDVNNRGNLVALAGLNDNSGRGNDRTGAVDAGNGFLMRQGYVIAASGWDVTTPPGKDRLMITVPIAHNPDGSPIIGPALEELVIDGKQLKGRLTYPADDLKSQASLTQRNHYSDEPVLVANSHWEFVDAQTIQLLPPGTPFQMGSLYELSYEAKNPLIAGLGFAATRDFAAFLRERASDDDGYTNPLAGTLRFLYTFSISQPSRFIHDFLYLGFNESEGSKRVFDAVFSYTAGASGGFFNYRFAQPGRTHRQHIARWYPELQFPFADQVTYDPVTRKTDGRLRRCLATNTCPKIFEVNSENEYWSKGGSLLHTDTRGKDLRLDGNQNVRIYLLSSLPHGTGGLTGICQQPANSIVPNPVNRALLIALDQWTTEGKTPPASRVPRLSDGTLAPPLPQEAVGFPTIPGVTYNGVLHTGDLFDFGPSFKQGILTILPPKIKSSTYPVYVPRTDHDGNDIAGVRLPEIAVPLATHTGWALRGAPPSGDGCDGTGQTIAFAKTKAARVINGDPRPSIEERYQKHDRYVAQVKKTVTVLVKERFLLKEDADRYVEAAKSSDVVR